MYRILDAAGRVAIELGSISIVLALVILLFAPPGSPVSPILLVYFGLASIVDGVILKGIHLKLDNGRHLKLSIVPSILAVNIGSVVMGETTYLDTPPLFAIGFAIAMIGIFLSFDFYEHARNDLTEVAGHSEARG